MSGLAQKASKLQLGKVHRLYFTVIMSLETSSETVSCLIRLTESGVEVEEWEEALESLRELADCYTEEDF